MILVLFTDTWVCSHSRRLVAVCVLIYGNLGSSVVRTVLPTERRREACLHLPAYISQGLGFERTRGPILVLVRVLLGQRFHAHIYPESTCVQSKSRHGRCRLCSTCVLLLFRQHSSSTDGIVSYVDGRDHKAVVIAATHKALSSLYIHAFTSCLLTLYCLSMHWVGCFELGPCKKTDS